MKYQLIDETLLLVPVLIEPTDLIENIRDCILNFGSFFPSGEVSYVKFLEISQKELLEEVTGPAGSQAANRLGGGMESSP